MKKNLIAFIISLMIIPSIIVSAQDSLELRQIKNTFKIYIQDSVVYIEASDTMYKYIVHKAPNEQYYKFINPEAIPNLQNILGIDRTEISERFSNAFPALKPIEQILNRAAASNGGIYIYPTPFNSDITREELGGTYNNIPENQSETNWLYILLATIVGLVVGYIIRALGSKKSTTVSKVDAVSMEEALSDVSNTDSDKQKIEKLTAKVQKLTADKKTMTSDIKSLKSKHATVESSLDKVVTFHKNYYKQAFDQLVMPLNNAIQKGNEAEIIQMLIKNSAHLASITRDQLGMKQGYDAINISSLLKQPNPTPVNIPIVNSNTPLDSIPKEVQHIMQVMKKNNVKSIDNAIVLGYKLES